MYVAHVHTFLLTTTCVLLLSGDGRGRSRQNLSDFFEFSVGFDTAARHRGAAEESSAFISSGERLRTQARQLLSLTVQGDTFVQGFADRSAADACG